MGVVRSAQESLFGTVQTLPGQTGIYPQSTPALIRSGSNLTAVWITDDLTKTDNNRTSLLYAVYADGQWSAPGKVAEDGTADFYPTLAPITDGALAAWQNTGVILDAVAEIDQIMAQQEIAVCRYDDAGHTWGPAVNLTGNDYLDRSPELAAAADKAALVWVANSQNDMLGAPDKPNNCNGPVRIRTKS